MNGVKDFIGLKATSRLLDLSEPSVRRLARTGILTVARDENNRRRFSLKQVKKLAKVRAKRVAR